jgi:transposase
MFMRKRAKQYAREYVARAVALCESSNQPVAQVARELGVEYGTLWTWMSKAGKTKRKELGLPGATTLTGQPTTPAAMAAELERLQRELEEVKKERDFLKKAAAFFAQQNK